MNHFWLGLACLVIAASTGIAFAQWQPADGPLATRWAKDVSPDNALPEYPRPQMVRADWLNLNGLWEYALRGKDDARPQTFDGQILVPFAIESSLSGVGKRVEDGQCLWYRRALTVPAAWSERHVLLHFGAVDWETEVFVNGQSVGTHRGGYDPFTFDITAALRPEGTQELVVRAWDPTDAGAQPRGKQVRKPHGIWYTPTTGIWQTVWLEPVPELHIRSLRLTPDLGCMRLIISAEIVGPTDGLVIEATALVDGREVATVTDKATSQIDLTIPEAHLWSPDDPFLYDLRVTLRQGEDGDVLDQVTCYFGMRNVNVGADPNGVTRILLNDKPLFMFGLLDQGFWPDGLYTAPTDEALRYDIEISRRLGFNTARKHVKVEPDRWYYWCDRLGLLVWQDMPSGDRYIGPNDADIERSPESAQQYERELRGIMDALVNHPSIVMWVPFNEGWGQFDTGRIATWIKEHDLTRLVNSASGWTDRGVGDVHDIHAYPGPASPKPEPKRAAVLGEFGGLGLPLKGHTWQDEKNWGYRSFDSREKLTAAYVDVVEKLRPLIADPGLSAAIYTQTTDVEIEVNGVMTYDRAEIKIDPAQAAAVAARLFLPPPRIVTIEPTSEEKGRTWRCTTSTPAEGWERPDFDDSGWTEAVAGFGRNGTPGIVVRSEWQTEDIWLRRSFEVAELPASPRLRLYHDEDCEVYVNGRRAAAVTGYTTSYIMIPLEEPGALRQGRNVFAVHCHNTHGGQGVDVGLIDWIEPGESTKPQ
ncbi:MAG: glycoside hydrolase family 2 TIM barrel-domain containing protein [Phycisphaerae bacterium]|jgi:hypothetical protein